MLIARKQSLGWTSPSLRLSVQVRSLADIAGGNFLLYCGHLSGTPRFV